VKRTGAKYQRYLAYLASPAWKKKRQEAFKSHGRTCQRCGKRARRLHVHHKTYRRLFREEMADLEVLCIPCHKKEHGVPLKRRKKRKRPA